MPLDIHAIKRGFHRLGYSELNLIGGGASAQVLSVKKHSMQLALKCIALPELVHEWETEKEVLSELEHPHIISLFGITLFDTLGVFEMELLASDLMTVIEHNRLPAGEHLKLLFGQVLSAVNHCHEQGIAHMDIKPENILVDAQVETAKIADFGSAIRFVPGKVTPSSSKKLGTFFYCAPEVINCVDFYPDKADIWSLGILLYTLTTKTWPYLATKSLHNQIAAGKVQIAGVTDPRLRQLIKMMLQFDPLDRPSIDEILAHPWFNQASSNINSTSDTPEGRKNSRPRLVMETSPRKFEELKVSDAALSPEEPTSPPTQEVGNTTKPKGKSGRFSKLRKLLKRL